MIDSSQGRAGTFSSSNIYRLMTVAKDRKSFGDPARTYIKEKAREKRLQREISNEVNSRPVLWGEFVETFAYSKIPDISYTMVSKDRLHHPEIKNWSGCPDLLSGQKVGDIKCPWTLTSFCNTIESMTSVEEFKKANPAYYWQLVSNAILCGVAACESFIFVPYQNELDEIREMLYSFDGDQSKYAFINWAKDEDLPYLLEAGAYKNLIQFTFEPLEGDKERLTDAVIRANIELMNY